jgi:AraC-like DNA-binding protein
MLAAHDDSAIARDLDHFEEIRLQQGLGVAITRGQLDQDAVSTLHGQDMVKFHIRLSGQRILAFPGADAVALDGAATAVLVHDIGVPKIERVVAGREELSVTTMMPRALFHEFLDQEGIKTPEALRTMMVRKGARPRLLIATPTQQELAIADAIVNCRRVGPLRRLFIEAKVAEFFCLVIDRLQADSYSPQSAARVTERDRRQLARVHDLLEECYTSPPTILELARQFGLNRNKLCSGFTQLYGKSIFDFCQQLRMEKARQLLAESMMSVLEVAVSAGYTSASAFSAAFHRRFGHAPSEIRRRGIAD